MIRTIFHNKGKMTIFSPNIGQNRWKKVIATLNPGHCGQIIAQIPTA
jgi:hypothetical protein